VSNDGLYHFIFSFLIGYFLTCVCHAYARHSYRRRVRLSVRLSVRHTLVPSQNYSRRIMQFSQSSRSKTSFLD